MTSTPSPETYLPIRRSSQPEFAERIEHEAKADPLAEIRRKHGANIAEISRRLDAVKQQLDAVRAKRK